MKSAAHNVMKNKKYIYLEEEEDVNSDLAFVDEQE